MLQIKQFGVIDVANRYKISGYSKQYILYDKLDLQKNYHCKLLKLDSSAVLYMYLIIINHFINFDA